MPRLPRLPRPPRWPPRRRPRTFLPSLNPRTFASGKSPTPSRQKTLKTEETNPGSLTFFRLFYLRLPLSYSGYLFTVTIFIMMAYQERGLLRFYANSLCLMYPYLSLTLRSSPLKPPNYGLTFIVYFCRWKPQDLDKAKGPRRLLRAPLSCTHSR